MCIHCEMNTSIKLINTSITSHGYHLCVCADNIKIYSRHISGVQYSIINSSFHVAP